MHLWRQTRGEWSQSVRNSGYLYHLTKKPAPWILEFVHAEHGTTSAIWKLLYVCVRNNGSREDFNFILSSPYVQLHTYLTKFASCIYGSPFPLKTIWLFCFPCSILINWNVHYKPWLILKPQQGPSRRNRCQKAYYTHYYTHDENVSLCSQKNNVTRLGDCEICGEVMVRNIKVAVDKWFFKRNTR